MKRPGLFRLFYWRALVLTGCCLAVALGLAYAAVTGQAARDWQDDLQQQTDWIASLWTEATQPADMADNWRMSHDTVRLVVRAPGGKIVADSHPELGAVSTRIAASAPIPGGELILSRTARPLALPPPQWLLVPLALAAAASLLVIPLVRRLQSGLRRVSDFAARLPVGEAVEPPAERELAELALSLNDLSSRLGEDETRRHRLIADLSHELRVPLTHLRSYAEAARQPGSAGLSLARLQGEIALMDRLVGDLQEMARLDEGAASLALQTVSVRAWAADLFDRSRPLIEAAGISFSSSFSDFDVEARIDPQRLAQTVGNLIDNAIAAVQGRRSPRIALALEVGMAEWSVIVTDNGCGIAEPDLPHIFERFYRADSRRGRTSGAGLGLSIAKAVADVHGGRIAVESLPDQGTTVRLAIRRHD